MAKEEYEAIVIGGGPGGYAAAIRLGQLGVKTVCVERENWGGICLNWGCIPSKALIAASNLYEKTKHASTMGLHFSDVKVNVKEMQAWKDGIVKKLTTGVHALIKGNGADAIIGNATFLSKDTVEVTEAKGDKTQIKATKAIVIATGTSVIQIPGFESDGKTIITAREAVSLQEVPKRLAIVGGGVIGMELGMVYQKLGSKVTVVEMQDQILTGVDKDLVRVVNKEFTKGENPADVFLKSKAKSIKVSKGVAELTVETPKGEEKIKADKVLMAIGFKPNTNELNLDKAGVKLDERGHVKVDGKFRTNVATIYGIGDVCGAPYLAHKANKEGEIAAEVIAGHNSEKDWRAMPAAIFTHPEIATVGMSEADAKAEGRKVKIGKFPFAVSGRAMAVSEAAGFVKIIVDEGDNEVLGVGMVGPSASDLIGETALAIEMGAYAEDVALTIHPHPTLSEGTMEAFKHAIGEAIHIMNK